MTHLIQILHRSTGAVLFEHQATDDEQQSGLATRAALEAAVRVGAYLDGAYLDGAHLAGAYLDGAYLDGAHLAGAYLDGGLKLAGPRPVLQVGPVGSRGAMLLAFITDRGPRLRTGCFFGTRAEFVASVRSTHADNNHAADYLAALALIDHYVASWTPKAEESAEEEVAA